MDETRDYPQTRLVLTGLDIDQTSDSLRIERTYRDPRGENVTFMDRLAFDGGEWTFEYRGIPRTSSLSWSRDGKSAEVTVVISYTRNGETKQGVTKEIWALQDARTLTVTRTSPLNPDDVPLVYFYQKQK